MMYWIHSLWHYNFLMKRSLVNCIDVLDVKTIAWWFKAVGWYSNGRNSLGYYGKFTFVSAPENSRVDGSASSWQAIHNADSEMSSTSTGYFHWCEAPWWKYGFPSPSETIFVARRTELVNVFPSADSLISWLIWGFEHSEVSVLCWMCNLTWRSGRWRCRSTRNDHSSNNHKCPSTCVSIIWNK